MDTPSLQNKYKKAIEIGDILNKNVDAKEFVSLWEEHDIDIDGMPFIRTIGCDCCAEYYDTSKQELISLYERMIAILNQEIKELKFQLQYLDDFK